MDVESLFKHRAFNGLEPAQMKLLRQFAQDIKGKGAMEVSRLYMQLNSRLSQIKPISPTQRSAIVDALRNFLPESNRQKLDSFIKMLGR